MWAGHYPVAPWLLGKGQGLWDPHTPSLSYYFVGLEMAGHRELALKGGIVSLKWQLKYDLYKCLYFDILPVSRK